jgi:hypothetical protein
MVMVPPVVALPEFWEVIFQVGTLQVGGGGQLVLLEVAATVMMGSS